MIYQQVSLEIFLPLLLTPTLHPIHLVISIISHRIKTRRYSRHSSILNQVLFSIDAVLEAAQNPLNVLGCPSSIRPSLEETWQK